jgi:hypothetical protein
VIGIKKQIMFWSRLQKVLLNHGGIFGFRHARKKESDANLKTATNNYVCHLELYLF